MCCEQIDTIQGSLNIYIGLPPFRIVCNAIRLDRCGIAQTFSVKVKDVEYTLYTD